MASLKSPKQVSITALGFDPSVLHITPGEVVHFVNNDTTTVVLIFADGSVTISAGSQYHKSFPSAGDFVYTDGSRRTGEISVKDATPP